MTKRTWVILISVLVIIAVAIGVKFPRKSSVVTVPMQQNYQMIPAYTQNDGKPQQVFDNAQVTPTLFFSESDPASKELLTKVNEVVVKLGSLNRPLIYMDTYLKVSDPQKALTGAMAYAKQNKITGTVLVQAGDPKLYAAQVPSFVYFDQGTPKVITDQKQILDLLPGLLKLDKGAGTP